MSHWLYYLFFLFVITPGVSEGDPCDPSSPRLPFAVRPHKVKSQLAVSRVLRKPFAKLCFSILHFFCLYKGSAKVALRLCVSDPFMVVLLVIFHALMALQGDIKVLPHFANELSKALRVPPCSLAKDPQDEFLPRFNSSETFCLSG